MEYVHLRALSDAELNVAVERLQRLAEALDPKATAAAAILHQSYAEALSQARAELERRAAI